MGRALSLAGNGGLAIVLPGTGACHALALRSGKAFHGCGMMNGLDLDSLGILADTDKCSLRWDYLRHYEEAFGRFREGDINILEIGVMNGASLRMWEQYFTRATIVGIDIRPECSQFAGGRKIVSIGSQIDAEFLDGVTAKYPPTVIIDDGSHVADHVQFSFEALFPRLAPGGCYVIEDITTHSPDSRFRGTAPLDTVDFIVRVASLTLAHGADTGLSPALDAVIRQIDKVTLIGAAALVWKRRVVDLAAVIAAKTALLEQAGSAALWCRLSRFIVLNDGPLDAAEAAARRAISLRPNGSQGYIRLGVVLDKKGDLAGALAATKAAAARRAGAKRLHVRIESLEKRLARPAAGA